MEPTYKYLRRIKRWSTPIQQGKGHDGSVPYFRSASHLADMHLPCDTCQRNNYENCMWGCHSRERYLHTIHILAKEVATLHQTIRRKERRNQAVSQRSAVGIRIYRLGSGLRHHCRTNILPANITRCPESSRVVRRVTGAWTKARFGGQEYRARELRGIPALEPESTY